jgi:hypothetical protein
MEQRHCPKCGQVKKLSAFGKRSRNADGRHEVCRSCVNETARRWRTANPERAREVKKRYRDQHPDADREQAGRWRAAHPEQVSEYARRYRESHREQIAAYQRSASFLESVHRWRENNKERYLRASRRWRERNSVKLAEWYRKRRRRAGPRLYSQQEWEALLDRYGHRCLRCGIHEQGTPQGFLVADHVVPVCMGGPYTIDNIQPLCFDCNRIKNGRAVDYRRTTRSTLS